MIFILDSTQDTQLHIRKVCNRHSKVSYGIAESSVLRITGVHGAKPHSESFHASLQSRIILLRHLRALQRRSLC